MLFSVAGIIYIIIGLAVIVTLIVLVSVVVCKCRYEYFIVVSNCNAKCRILKQGYLVLFFMRSLK